MDDIQLVLYIIFVIIAILARAFKSNKNKQAPPPPPSNREESPNRKKPMSFEDLLKEFEESSSSGQKKVKQEPEPVSTYESYEYESEIPDDDEVRSVYEDSLKRAKEFKTIDELVDLEDDRHIGNFKHFGGYSEEEVEGHEESNEYLQLLQDAEGAKKAIILSEIINRKY